jgi:hypothetical protein
MLNFNFTLYDLHIHWLLYNDFTTIQKVQAFSESYYVVFKNFTIGCLSCDLVGIK